tara:strand:+ start:210 stop:1112 length:903 start_codon:yes stop_codon:yes gene_type:complete
VSSQIERQLKTYGRPISRISNKWEGKYEKEIDGFFPRTPIGTPSLNRAIEFLEILKKTDARFFYSDHSLELSILARSAGVPVVMTRQHGKVKECPMGKAALDCSDLLIAPYPKLRGDCTYASEKTLFTGFFSKYSNICLKGVEQTEGVTILLGHESLLLEDIEEIADCIYPSQLFVVGSDQYKKKRSNITIIGRVPCVASVIKTENVITAGGNNSLAELYALNKKVIIAPEPRPFDEQLVKAQLLTRNCYAQMKNVDEHSSTWSQLLEQTNRTNKNNINNKFLNSNAPQQIAHLLREKYA